MKLTKTKNQFQKHRILSYVLLCSSLFCIFLAISGHIQSAFALPLEEELEIDRVFGVLNRPWKINLIRVASRDYLRTRSQVTTGLPPYDQQIEHSNFLPASLYSRLTTPAISSTPPSIVSVPVPAPTPVTTSPEAPAGGGGGDIIEPIITFPFKPSP